MAMSMKELREWRASKIDRVVLTADALDDFFRVQYGGVEIGGGAYGEIVNGAILVRELLDLSRDATHHAVTVSLGDMVERSLSEHGRTLVGHFHTHEEWARIVVPSSSDRIVWQEMARAFAGPFLALIASPTSPGSEMTGPIWGSGGNWSGVGVRDGRRGAPKPPDAGRARAQEVVKLRVRSRTRA
jgi:hypothetical protein